VFFFLTVTRFIDETPALERPTAMTPHLAFLFNLFDSTELRQ